MPITFHRFALSGHCHRVELLLSMLELEHQTIEVDLLTGQQKSAAFVALNPFGQVPVIQDDDLVVADSLAILVYLARKYDRSDTWLPSDFATYAQVQRWFSVAAGALVNGPAIARAAAVFKRDIDVAPAIAIANLLMSRLDEQLARQPFLVGTCATVADLAMYSYTAHAPEGGISLRPFSNVRAWLQRVEALPLFVAMPSSHTAAMAEMP
jgi:glutathione S-transferase